MRTYVLAQNLHVGAGVSTHNFFANLCILLAISMQNLAYLWPVRCLCMTYIYTVTAQLNATLDFDFKNG